MNNNALPDIRTGNGFDVHRLVEGRRCVICGVEIPSALGLLGHSDADVALHALCDALLGAAALGDIGKHFPDTDNQWKGADSTELLKAVGDLVAEQGFSVLNVDITVIAQQPKIAPHIPAMRQRVAKTIGIEMERVSVKATTTEHLGFTGRGEGIASIASCTIGKF